MSDHHSEKPAIRPARDEDVNAIRAIMEEAVSRLPSRDWFIDDDTAFIARHIRDEGYTLLCVYGSVIAGYLMVRHPKPGPDHLGTYLGFTEEQMRVSSHIESVGVLAAFQGRGIFRTLLARAEEIERDESRMKTLLATVHPDNRFSRLNMERQGFLPALAVVKYGFDRLVMRKDL